MAGLAQSSMHLPVKGHNISFSSVMLLNREICEEKDEDLLQLSSVQPASLLSHETESPSSPIQR